MDGIWPNFVYTSIMTGSTCKSGLLSIIFSQIYNRVTALDRCQNYIFLNILRTNRHIILHRHFFMSSLNLTFSEF